MPKLGDSSPQNRENTEDSDAESEPDLSELLLVPEETGDTNTISAIYEAVKLCQVYKLFKKSNSIAVLLFTNCQIMIMASFKFMFNKLETSLIIVPNFITIIFFYPFLYIVCFSLNLNNFVKFIHLLDKYL